MIRTRELRPSSKGATLLPLCFLVLVLLLPFVCGGTAFAVDYTITIDDANLNKNQDIIFEEINIGPGFSRTYNVHVNNQSSSSVMFGIHDFQEDIANSLTLNDLNLVFKRSGTALFDFRKDTTEGSFSCLNQGTNNLFTFKLSLDPSFGNEYQGRSFVIDITFQANASDCHNDSTVDPPQSPTMLPKTGESSGFYYFWLGGTILFSATTVILLIIFIIARKRDKEGEKHEKDPI